MNVVMWSCDVVIRPLLIKVNENILYPNLTNTKKKFVLLVKNMILLDRTILR